MSQKLEKHNECKKTYEFKAKLSGRNEVPANCSKAHGYLKAVLSHDKKKLYFKIKFEGLKHITAAHFHLAPECFNGPVVRNLKFDNCSNIIEGKWTQCDAEQPLFKYLVKQLFKGKIYVNIHTKKYPDGEIRGQLREICY